MGYENLLTNFVGIPYFTKENLLVLADRFDISKATLNTVIQRAIKTK